MKKYRSSILIFATALMFSGLHFYFGWNDFVIEQHESNTEAQMSDWMWRYAKEEVEGFPADLSALGIELLLFAGLLSLFKPYDEDTEKIKNLEKALHKRFDALEDKL